MLGKQQEIPESLKDKFSGKNIKIITLDKFNIINHPDNGVDLCAIPIASLDSYSQEYKVRLYRGKLGTDLIINENEVKDCSAMEDIIMIGYPNGLIDEYALTSGTITTSGQTDNYTLIAYVSDQYDLPTDAGQAGSGTTQTKATKSETYSFKVGVSAAQA